MDKIEAQKDLVNYKENIRYIDALNHLNSNYAFKQACIAERKELVKRIQNIEWQMKQVR